MSVFRTLTYSQVGQQGHNPATLRHQSRHFIMVSEHAALSKGCDMAKSSAVYGREETYNVHLGRSFSGKLAPLAQAELH